MDRKIASRNQEIGIHTRTFFRIYQNLEIDYFLRQIGRNEIGIVFNKNISRLSQVSVRVKVHKKMELLSDGRKSIAASGYFTVKQIWVDYYIENILVGLL